MKIFRKNSNQAAQNKLSDNSKQSSDLIQQQNRLERNPYFPKKQANISNNSPQSSSSSSVASSNEDNDPGKELIRMQKRTIKDKKEIDNFIDKLSSTLRAAEVSRNESEIEQDEIVEDLEEDAIQAESSDQEDEFNLNRKNQPNGSYQLQNNYVGVRNSNDFKNKPDHEEDKFEFEFDFVKRPNRNENSAKNDSGISSFGVATLGATNHMFTRINTLEG